MAPRTLEYPDVDDMPATPVRTVPAPDLQFSVDGEEGLSAAQLQEVNRLFPVTPDEDDIVSLAKSRKAYVQRLLNGVVQAEDSQDDEDDL